MHRFGRLRASLPASLFASLIVVACSSADDPGVTPGDDGGTGPDAPTTQGCGREGDPCPVGAECEGAQDCSSGSCREGTCQQVEPTNGVKNGDETDVDCGGKAAPACADGKQCLVVADCVSGVCKGGVCQVPSATDGVKNGDETDVDCGGASGKKCATGEGCKADADCDAVKCDLAKKTCSTPENNDKIKNGDETDVDCGGTAPTKCATGQGCLADKDCDNVLCDATKKTCAAPSPTDKLKNGTETDVDCGGGAPTNAPACEAEKVCAANTDCKSGGCNHLKKCAWARSCTMQRGGTTCGTGDSSDPNNKNEDCCASAEVPAYANQDGYSNPTAFRLDKYTITSGRIRRFLDAVQGNVKGWVTANRAKILAPDQLPTKYDALLPTGWIQGNSNDDCRPNGTAPGDPVIKCNYGALNHVNGYRYNNDPGGDGGFGCYMGPAAYGTRTFYTTAAENTLAGLGEAMHKVPKDRLDEKSMTCGTFLIYAAFCAWDGGRLETWDEYNAAYGGDWTTSSNTITSQVGRKFPWGSDMASRPIGFTFIGAANVSPTVNYGYTPPADATNGQYGVNNANLTPAQRAALLLRIQRANMSWNYVDGFLFDYVSGLENRAQKRILAETNFDVKEDQSVAVAPPGRYPMGAGKYGHFDLLGNVMEISATPNPGGGGNVDRRRWTRNASFETSHYAKDSLATMVGYSTYNFPVLTKYGRTGARCARPMTVYPTTALPETP